MPIVKAEMKALSTLDNIVLLSQPKARLPGDLAIKYAAMVLVTLMITYKLVKFLILENRNNPPVQYYHVRDFYIPMY